MQKSLGLMTFTLILSVMLKTVFNVNVKCCYDISQMLGLPLSELKFYLRSLYTC